MYLREKRIFRKWAKVVGASVVAFTFASVFWRKIFVFYFPGVDEWNFFAMFSSLRGGGELASFIFTPYLGHFVPLFKGVMYIEYSVFRLSPLPYHWVSILLFSVCLMLFFLFLCQQIGDRVLAAALTVFLGMNSVYYPILMWMMHHQALLCFMFILLALIMVGRLKDRQAAGGYLATGALCMLAALSYGMGVLSWPLVVAYYLMERRRDGEGLRKPYPVMWMLGPAVLFAVLFLFASPGTAGTGALTVNPLRVLPGMSGLLGNVLLESSGFTVPPLLADFMGMGVAHFYEDQKAAKVFVGINTAVFLLWGAFVSFGTWKAGRRMSGGFFLGIIWVVLSTSLLLVSRMEHYGGVMKMTNIPRYHFFPLIGLVMATAPTLLCLRKRYGRRFLVACAITLVLFGFVHQERLGELARLDAEEIRERKRTVSILRSRMQSSRSGYVEEYPGMNLSALPYETFLTVFAGEEDRVSSTDGMVLVLRKHRSIRDGEIEVLSGRRLRGSFIEASGEPVSLRIAGSASATYQHLSFRMKSQSPVEGMLTCLREGGERSTVSFTVKAAWFWREYLLPCPKAQGMNLEIQPGTYAIRDMKLYW